MFRAFQPGTFPTPASNQPPPAPYGSVLKAPKSQRKYTVNHSVYPQVAADHWVLLLRLYRTMRSPWYGIERAPARREVAVQAEVLAWARIRQEKADKKSTTS